MCSPKVISTPPQDLATTSTSYVFTPAGPVFEVNGVSTVDIIVHQYGTNAYFESEAAVRYFTDRMNRPEAWADFSATAQSGDTDYVQSPDISTPAANRMYAQFGVAYRSTNSNNPAQGSVQVDLILRKQGDTIGNSTLQLNPGLNTSTQTAVYTLTAWRPTRGLSTIKAALIYEQISGTLEDRLMIRFAATDTKEPGAWTSLESFNSVSTGNDSRNTGNMTPTLGSNMFYQIGYEVKGTDGQGAVHIIVGESLS